MAHEIPSSQNFTGLSRTVLEYGEAFGRLVERLKEPDLPADAWAPLEKLIDTDNFVRQGVFLTAAVETINWQRYKSYITQYAGATHWEATLRHLTEGPNRVIQELEERNTSSGFTHIANTVTAYGFDDKGRVRTLEVYVMSLN